MGKMVSLSFSKVIVGSFCLVVCLFVVKKPKAQKYGTFVIVTELCSDDCSVQEGQ